jgi:DNA-binding HxlR family transcriptional regulator
MKSVVKEEEVISKHQCGLHVRNITDALYVLHGKWKLPLIFTLREQPRRFNEILQQLDSITPKVLSKELRDLEINGFVERKVYPTTPVTVIYEATSYSDTLKNVLSELGQWGEQHREKIRQSIRDDNKRALA